MQIPKVSRSIYLKKLLKKIVCSLTVLNARPKIESVCHTPTGSLVTSFGESVLCRIDPSGSRRIDHVTGIKSYELRDMSVCIFSKITVVVLLEELLDLTGESHSDRIVFVYLSEYRVKNCIVLVRYVVGVDAESRSREKKVVVVLVCEGLSIACALTGKVPYTVYVLLG